MKNGVIVETMMISRTERIPAFSIRTGFSVFTGSAPKPGSRKGNDDRENGAEAKTIDERQPPIYQAHRGLRKPQWKWHETLSVRQAF
jgi:hypothetical protein